MPNSSGASDSKKVTPIIAKSMRTIAMMKKAFSTGMMEAGGITMKLARIQDKVVQSRAKVELP